MTYQIITELSPVGPNAIGMVIAFSMSFRGFIDSCRLKEAILSKIIPVLGVIILAFAVAPLAHADPIYGTSALGELTGSRSEPGSIVTGDEWADDETIQSLSWLVMDLGGGAWSYEYTFTNFRAPDISHFILDLTDDCVGRDDEAADPGCVRYQRPPGVQYVR